MSENGQVLMDDSEIDLKSIHRRFEHCWCADEKHARYRFGLYCGFEDGLCALSWTIYPDGRYFADDGGFGADDNGEENVYCIINTDMEVVVPFRPMADVREELRRRYCTRTVTIAVGTTTGQASVRLLIRTGHNDSSE